ncbi:MAG: hypothetical protein Q7R79_00075, partial [bacterium]|nr:hypothetical protein [bacterium]
MAIRELKEPNEHIIDINELTHKARRTLSLLEKAEKERNYYERSQLMKTAYQFFDELEWQPKKVLALLKGGDQSFEAVVSLFAFGLQKRQYSPVNMIRTIVDNLPILAKQLSTRSPLENRGAAYRLLGAILQDRSMWAMILTTSQKNVTKIHEFLWKNHERLIKDFFEGTVEDVEKPLAYMLLKESTERSDELLKKLTEKIKDTNSLSEGTSGTLIKWVYDGGYLGDVGKVLISKWLTQFGFDEKILNDWLSVEYDQTLIREYVERNIHTIVALEKKAPSSARVLWKDFGIRHFARYPVDILLRQYHSREDTTKQYGVAMMATNDPGGSFAIGHAMWSDFEKQLRAQGLLLRISEISNKVEFLKRLITSDRRYGKTQKISFMVLGSHGSNDYLELGGNTDDDSIELIKKSDFSPRIKKQEKTRASTTLKSKRFFVR